MTPTCPRRTEYKHRPADHAQAGGAPTAQPPPGPAGSRWLSRKRRRPAAIPTATGRTRRDRECEWCEGEAERGRVEKDGERTGDVDAEVIQRFAGETRRGRPQIRTQVVAEVLDQGDGRSGAWRQRGRRRGPARRTATPDRAVGSDVKTPPRPVGPRGGAAGSGTGPRPRGGPGPGERACASHGGPPSGPARSRSGGRAAGRGR